MVVRRFRAGTTEAREIPKGRYARGSAPFKTTTSKTTSDTGEAERLEKLDAEINRLKSERERTYGKKQRYQTYYGRVRKAIDRQIAYLEQAKQKEQEPNTRVDVDKTISTVRGSRIKLVKAQEYQGKVTRGGYIVSKEGKITTVGKPTSPLPTIITKTKLPAEEVPGYKYTDYELGTKEKLAQLFGKISEKQTYASLSPLGLNIPGGEIVDVSPQPQTQFIAGVGKGYTEEWFRNPEKQAILVTAGAILPPALGKVGQFLQSQQVPGAYVTTANLGTAIGVTAGTYYGATKVTELVTTPGAKAKGMVLGKTGAELSAISAGAIGFAKTVGYLRTIGKEKVPTEKLVPQDVLSGKEKFPVIKGGAKAQLKLFKYQSKRLPGQTEARMFHATGQLPKLESGKFIVGEGSSEFAGLYGSYGVSPHFLKVPTGYAKPTGWDAFNVFGYSYPTAVAVKPSKFQIKGYKVVSRDPLKAVFTGKTQQGVGYVPGLKSEVEAILTPGTTVKVESFPYYSVWKGVRYPVGVGESVAGSITPPVVPGTTAVSSSKTISGISLGYSATTGIFPSTPSSVSPSPSITYLSVSTPKSYPSVSSISSPSVPSSVSKPSSYSPPSSIISSSVTPPSSPISSSYPSYYSPPSSVIKVPFLPGTMKGESAKPYQEGFRVQVKTKQRYKTIASGLPFGRALTVGSQRVLTTPLTRFRLRGFGAVGGAKLPKEIRQVKGKTLTFEEVLKKRKRRKKK